MFTIEVKRDTYTLQSTVGKLYLNQKFFGHTLEDVSRGENIKIPGETAIPTGMYRVVLSTSSRFKRLMPMIYTEANQYEIKMQGIRFTGVRIHGGNRSKDTHGCILIAENRINDDLIQGSLEEKLTEALQQLGGKGILVVTNETQSK
jgi:hypothetical protein